MKTPIRLLVLPLYLIAMPILFFVAMAYAFAIEDDTLRPED